LKVIAIACGISMTNYGIRQLFRETALLAAAKQLPNFVSHPADTATM